MEFKQAVVAIAKKIQCNVKQISDWLRKTWAGMFSFMLKIDLEFLLGKNNGKVELKD